MLHAPGRSKPIEKGRVIVTIGGSTGVCFSRCVLLRRCSLCSESVIIFGVRTVLPLDSQEPHLQHSELFVI
jgi:hypothetical protein